MNTQRCRFLLGAGLLCLCVQLYPARGHAQAAPRVRSSAEIQAARDKGATLGRELQGGAVVESDGDIARDADQSVHRDPTNSGQASANAALAQDLVGLSSYQSTASPAGREGQAGAAASVTSFADFACGLSAGTVRTVAGHTLRFNGCHLQDSRVIEVGLQICSKLVTGNLCAPEDFSAPAFYGANAYSRIGDVDVGIGCNDAIRSCRVTVSSSFSVQTTGASLAQEAQNRQGGAEFRAAVADIVASPVYQDESTQQQETRDCYVRNQQSALSAGTVTTCDGRTSAAVAGASQASSCTPSRTCVRETALVKSYETTCTRTFSLTMNQCTVEVPTRECTITRDVATGTQTSSCPADEMQGALVVSTSPESCTRTEDATESETPTAPKCLEVQYIESNVFPDRAQQVGDCVATPAPIAGGAQGGSCSIDPQDRELSCPEGGWYGRTLADQECQIFGTDDSGAELSGSADFRAKPGCGYCARQQVGTPCRAQPSPSEPTDSCSGVNLASCTLLSSQVQSQQFGLALSQLESYRCSQTETQCAQWRVTDNCTNIDASYGVDQMPQQEVGDQGAFSQVLAANAIVEGIAQSGDGAASDPQIFGGQDLRCSKPLGFLDGVVSNDCCKINLQRTGGSRPANACSQDEVKLAAARRAHHEVFVGSYCSKKRRFGFFSRCVQETQTYCVFSGVLPRIVQTEGREQLAAAASQGSSSRETRAFGFSYYAGSGGWVSPLVLQGYAVSAFQQPQYCASSVAAAAYLSAHPQARECPSALGIWFAVCTKAAGCGDLPLSPEGGSADWQLKLVDPLQATQSALSRNVLARGACNTESQQCVYEISAWPSGVNGRAVLKRDLVFDMTMRETVDQAARTVLLGDVLLRVTPAAATTLRELPQSMPAEYSLDGGSTWTALALPTQIQAPFTIAGSDVQITGGCALATGLCEYALVGSIEIAAKPWGSAKTPDCSGFTLEQFSALDFSAIDLTEWVASVQAKTPSASALQQQTHAQASEGNRWVATSPTQARVAQIRPLQDLGPFVATLSIAPNWPEAYEDPSRNTDPIYGVEIDWGDCSFISRAQAVPGGGFSAEHTYASPESPGICGRDGPAGPGAARTLDHQVRLSVDSKSGHHVVDLGVRNVFHDYTETDGSSGLPAGGVSQTATSQPPGTP